MRNLSSNCNTPRIPDANGDVLSKQITFVPSLTAALIEVVEIDGPIHTCVATPVSNALMKDALALASASKAVFICHV
jgi:hypothetical protein